MAQTCRGNWQGSLGGGGDSRDGSDTATSLHRVLEVGQQAAAGSLCSMSLGPQPAGSRAPDAKTSPLETLPS